MVRFGKIQSARYRFIARGGLLFVRNNHCNFFILYSMKRERISKSEIYHDVLSRIGGGLISFRIKFPRIKTTLHVLQHLICRCWWIETSANRAQSRDRNPVNRGSLWINRHPLACNSTQDRISRLAVKLPRKYPKIRIYAWFVAFRLFSKFNYSMNEKREKKIERYQINEFVARERITERR